MVIQPSEPETALGERLVAAGRLTAADLARAQRHCDGDARRLATVLSSLGLVTEAIIAAEISHLTGCPLVDTAAFPNEAVAPDLVRGRYLKRARALPLAIDDEKMVVAVADPTDTRTVQALRLASHRSIDLRVAEPTVIERAIDRLYFDGHEAADSEELVEELAASQSDADVERLKGQASEAPVVRLVAGMIASAVDLGASDVHIEPDDTHVGVRFRIDGRLTRQAPIPRELATAVISRVKILARLDIAERRLPQDGRVQEVVRGRTVDLRISTMPTIHGETAVIRILDRESIALEFDALGIVGDNASRLNEMLTRPHGMMLVTGPTGSGKTTTLYAGLTTINRPDVNILTVEDPVEYRLDGVKQVQVRSPIGLDFATVLRSMLRHDPDVILVGEIRDRITAEIAVQAALTGHLVLSTLHTNTALGAIPRLIDMGVEPYLLGASLVGVVAQRLVRTICRDCRTEVELPGSALARLSRRTGERTRSMGHFYVGSGCDACRHSGYRGRTLIMETAVVTPELRDALTAGATLAEMEEMARDQGFCEMLEDGLEKASTGITSLEEVLRVSSDSGTRSGETGFALAERLS